MSMWVISCFASDVGVVSVFFFDATATTGIYTNWHTLSLHYALPIYPDACRAAAPPGRPAAGRRPGRDRALPGMAGLAVGLGAQRRLRSEEHTSELQSLMRNSYAVFCLKKKNKTVSSMQYEPHGSIATTRAINVYNVTQKRT